MSGTLYCSDGINGGSGSKLWTLDPATAAPTLVGFTGFHGLFVLCFDQTLDNPRGFDTPPVLYGVAFNTSANRLSVFNPATGLSVGSPIGLISVTTDDLACSASGVLYTWGQDGNLYTIDKTTAVATLVGGPGDYITSYGLTFDLDGNLWLYGDGDVNAGGSQRQIDPATGAVLATTPLTGYDRGDAGAFSCASCDPDTGTIYLLDFTTGGGGALPDLVTVDQGTGVVSFVGTPVSGVGLGMRALAWSPPPSPPPPPPPPARRNFDGREWKFIVADLRTTTTISAVSSFATDISTSRLLHEPWPAQLTVPCDDPRVNSVFEGDGLGEPFVAEGVRTLIGFRDTGAAPRWEVAYTGIILQTEDQIDNGLAYVVVNAWDVRQYMRYLPVCNDAGEIPGDGGLSFTATKANVIARTLLDNLALSPWGLLLGVLLDTTTGTDEDCAELDINFQRGTSIADAWAALEQTGAIDIVLYPIYDPQSRAGTISQLNFFTQVGAERDTAIFAWGNTPRTLTDANRVENGNMRGNVVQFYDANGHAVTLQTDSTSVDKYGAYVVVQAFPGLGVEASVIALAVERLVLSANGQTIVTSTPAAPRAAQAIQDYDIGDRVPFYVDKSFRKPVAGLTRIYGIPFTIGQDALEEIDELRTQDAGIG